MATYTNLAQKAAAEQEFAARQKKGQQSFVDALRAALTPTNQEAGTLRSEQERLIREQATAPQDERTRLMGAGITDPFERQRRINASYGATGGRLSSIRSLLGSYGQSDENLVQRGVEGYQTGVEEQAAVAKAAQSQADDQKKADEAARKEVASIAKEERDYQRKVKLEQLKAALKPKKTPTQKEPKKSELDRAFNQDLNAFAVNVVTGGAPGADQVTREEIIDELAQLYPHKSRAAISKEVYAAYGDTHRVSPLGY